MPKQTKREVRNENRRQRVPMGAHRYKLQLSEEDVKGFEKRKMVPRWINDQDGRIQQALNGGYNFVKPEHATSLGEHAITEGNTDTDSRVSKVVSRGDPVIRAYLMEIKKEFYDEDQQAKEDNLRKVDDALMLGRNSDGSEIVENQYGNIRFTH